MSNMLFQDLDIQAKELARSWYREGAFDYEWYEAVYEDFLKVCSILGISIHRNNNSNNIYFSGFASQGDGACFEGTYHYAKGAVKNIQTYAPTDKSLQAIARSLQAVQRRNFYRLSANIVHRGRYCHEGTMDITIYDCPNADDEEALTETLRDLARWLYKQLESEYDYLSSDEAVDEAIIANEYYFDADGRKV